jgi:amidase
MDVRDATIAELKAALAAGRTTSVSLVRAYLARIAALDRAGPRLTALRIVNPDAEAIAAASDAGRAARPLEGVPILVKDNIATCDSQPTTAGALALEGATAVRDATVVARLRDAGAVLLGKTNLTEFANILAVGMPSGFSSLGGQVLNPYAPEVDGRGTPFVLPGGSSAGSAVAVAAGFAAAAIGTETSGSLLSPANMNGVVTVKPTVGLVSRAGIIPIAHSQDTAGPMTRTVPDAAILLQAIAGPDPLDEATLHAPALPDYAAALDRQGLLGARIGVPGDPADPGNDVFYGPLSAPACAVMERAITALQDCGATVIRANLPTEGWLPAPGTEFPILNRNPESPQRHQVARVPTVFVHELKRDMTLWLRDWGRGTSMLRFADLVAFNDAHAARALRFGQDIFLAADGTRGDLSEMEYQSARRLDVLQARTRGLDAYMDRHRLHAVLFPGSAGASIAAKAGYPSVMVPAGFVSGVAGRETPEYPLGATFAGRAWSEATLLRLAFAFEQATQARRMPPGL